MLEGQGPEMGEFGQAVRLWSLHLVETQVQMGDAVVVWEGGGCEGLDPVAGEVELGGVRGDVVRDVLEARVDVAAGGGGAAVHPGVCK